MARSEGASNAAPDDSIEDSIEVNKAGIGLALAGGGLMIIAVFLPRVESQKFLRVAENSLIQSGDGLFFIGLAVFAAIAVYAAYQRERKTYVPLVLGLVGIGLAIFSGTGDRVELTSAAGGGPIGLDFETETATPGIGIWQQAQVP